MSLLICILSLSSQSFTHPTVMKVSDTHDVDYCDLTKPGFFVVPCRPYEQLPVVLTPVDVDCDDMTPSFGGGDSNRCTDVV